MKYNDKIFSCKIKIFGKEIHQSNLITWICILHYHYPCKYETFFSNNCQNLLGTDIYTKKYSRITTIRPIGVTRPFQPNITIFKILEIYILKENHFQKLNL